MQLNYSASGSATSLTFITTRHDKIQMAFTSWQRVKHMYKKKLFNKTFTTSCTKGSHSNTVDLLLINFKSLIIPIITFHILWDVMPHSCFNKNLSFLECSARSRKALLPAFGSSSSLFLDCLTLKPEAIHSFETSVKYLPLDDMVLHYTKLESSFQIFSPCTCNNAD